MGKRRAAAAERAARRESPQRSPVGFRRAARTTAAARDLVEQVMLSVVEANETAIAMYERFGFHRYGTEPRALKSAAGYANQVLMVLCLNDLTPSLPNPDPTASDA
jgi:hypothetical protein